MNEYGYCPICGAAGKSRERRPDGNDICEQGHKYPSKNATVVNIVVDKTQFYEPPSTCISPFHNPPTGLYLAPKEQYQHICPECGEIKIIFGGGCVFSDFESTIPCVITPIDEDDNEDAFTAESNFEVIQTLKIE